MQDYRNSQGGAPRADRTLAVMVFIVFELVIAYWVFGTAGTLTGKYLNLLAILFGQVVAVAFFALVVTRRNLKVQLAIDFAAILFVLIGYVLPEHRAESQRQAEDQAHEARLKVEEQAYQIKLKAWLEDMKQTGKHAPPGVVPPMLTVEDDGITVRVQNNLDRIICAALARVRKESTVLGGWKGCGMFTEDGGGVFTICV
jgi:hypothetical protein